MYSINDKDDDGRFTKKEIVLFVFVGIMVFTMFLAFFIAMYLKLFELKGTLEDSSIDGVSISQQVNDTDSSSIDRYCCVDGKCYCCSVSDEEVKETSSDD